MLKNSVLQASNKEPEKLTLTIQTAFKWVETEHRIFKALCELRKMLQQLLYEP